MSRTPLVLRATAQQDIDAALDYYIREAPVGVAARFVDALDAAFRFIADHPGAGSPRYAHELALPGLRCHGLKRYPYLVFYIRRDDCVDIWRVLHAERDIPARMRLPGA